MCLAETTTTTNGETSPSSSSTAIKKTDTYFTIAEIEKHDKADDFWTVIDNVVYDLSGYSTKHPGGALILNAAGADCTVMYHQYHVLCGPEKPNQILAKHKIGLLKIENENCSPVMGDFWFEMARRVRAKLEHRERRPTLGKVLWILDALVMTCAIIAWPLGWYNLETTPIWILVVLNLILPNWGHFRMVGQLHASGHGQIFDPAGMAFWAEIYGTMLSPVGVYPFSMPNEYENPRKLLNKPRSESQYEFPAGRGFSEHTAVHHVKGTELDHDRCQQLVSGMGTFRYSDKHPSWIIPHAVQDYFLFSTAIGTGVEFASMILGFFNPFRLVFIFKHLLPQGEYLRSVAIIIGLCSGFSYLRCCLALPLSGWYGLLVFGLMAPLKEYFGLLSIHAFFAQHLWDMEIPEKEANKDWGRHNCETTFSYWPKTWDVVTQHFLWGPYSDAMGASPATLSYHCEHTMFPGVNYLYLPEIAPIVRDTCKEFGVNYPAIYSYSDLLRTRQEYLEKFKHKFGEEHSKTE